ncbi:MAG: hypothetical protein CMC79_04595 [Flavobacteriaceae bacterium]|nr:hypothetical protein [Flavobacteriaceae bacterium]|tara:strand:- start:20170 stop:20964 length:795 start_codon:yes stop_codon:yes gene_type:complete
MKSIIIFITFCFSLSVYGQKASIDNKLFDGNKKVQSKDFIGAETDYRIAISKSKETPKSLYNLGNAQYGVSAYEEAAQQFYKTQKLAEAKSEKHAAFHNMGNVYMQKKEYAKAVEAYKSALRNNTKDDETRYNYALAKSLLEDEKNNQKSNNGDKSDQKSNNDDKNDQKNSQNEDQNKKSDSSNEEKNSDQKNEEEKNPKDSSENKKNRDSKEQQTPKKRNPGQLSPDQVKSLLQAMNNQEKKVQDKINAKKVKGKPLKNKKDW